VVAEGGETRDQFDFLRRHRCDELQGYHFSRPVAPAAIGNMLARRAGAAAWLGAPPPPAQDPTIVFNRNLPCLDPIFPA
jgi:hypothetical protein